ncbi:MAG: hypothetical protein ACLP9S_04755 [Syntrophales bacterium]
MWNVQRNREENKYYRAFMDTYEWNYTVLGLVDYLEEKLFDDRVVEPTDTDLWLNFRAFCESRQLNWRVIRKMIEYFVNTPFESEMDLAKHEAFKPIKRSDGGGTAGNDNSSIESAFIGLSENLPLRK